MKQLKELLAAFTPKVLATAKAGVAFVVGFVVTWLARRGVEVDPSAQEALVSGLYGLVVAVWVFFVPNKK